MTDASQGTGPGASFEIPAPTFRIEDHPYPLLFATVSGAHLYGFPSPDSDYDVRGAHLLPVADVVGLKPLRETVESTDVYDGVEIDLVTHDAKKFFELMLKRNGYVLEQLFSPLVLVPSAAHAALQEIGAACVTRHHVHHYRGFAQTQWRLLLKESPPRIKPLLYVYRVLLTGIHLMRTGRIEANLLVLNDEADLPYVPDLIARKTAGAEQERLDANEVPLHVAEFERLLGELEQAAAQSALPETPSGRERLHDLLVELRLANL